MKATALAAVLLLIGVGFTRVDTQTAQPPAARPASAEQAVIDRYCATCHNQRTRAGNLALDMLDVTAAGREPQTWEKVVRKVRTGMMPPSGMPRPDRATLDSFAASIETAIDRVAANAPNPGAPSLHRLNRAEYGNAVRDVLDLPIDPAKLLPGDDSSGEGFDNMASTLSVSPALLQAYVTAAARISRLAIGDPTISTELTTYQAPRGMSQATQREGLPLGTRGGILVTHVFPLDAEYEFRVGRAGAGFFGLPAVGVEDDVEITIDGQRVQTVGRTPPRGGIKLKVAAGPHVVGVAVIRKANARGVDDLFAELANTAGVNSLGINGPINATGPGDTPSRRRIFICKPAAAIDEIPCARRILSSLATRATSRCPRLDPRGRRASRRRASPSWETT